MFDDARAKLRWAREHLDTLTVEIGAFFEANTYPAVAVRQDKALYIIKTLVTPVIPSVRWSLMVGDCVHNARASLDFVAWQLSGSVLADRQTLFPIYDNPAQWKARGTGRLAKLRKRHPEVAAYIETIQPFKVAAQVPTLVNALNNLRMLDEADKHKLLVVTIALADRLELSYEVPSGVLNVGDFSFQLVNIPQALRSDAVVAAIDIPNAPDDMEVKVSLAPTVAFGDGLGLPPTVRVIQSLHAMMDHATLVINNIESIVLRSAPSVP